ncbi:MAG TPA: glycoside hydrolase family 2 protein [Terriglobales bacterium]|nr:glycoside hydrolase family 2 protein [Terriglobales bacterium]
MKKSVFCFALFAFILMSIQVFAAGQKQVVSLNKGWQFRIAPDGSLNHVEGVTPDVDQATLQRLANWTAAEVPGFVQTDLLQNKIIPEPFYRENEKTLQWIGQEDWQYQSTFDVAASTLTRKHVELVFQGLDTYATVYLNGQGILRADNMFRTWRVDAKPHLKAGSNTLLITFRSPINEVLKQIEGLPYHLPSISALDADVEKGIGTDPYTRKAPYQYGWDWGPRFVTMGVWKPVTLESWDDAVIRNLHIAQNEVTADIANIAANLEIESDGNSVAKVTVSYTGSDSKSAKNIERTVTLHAGLNKISIAMEIGKPARWYPAGYGAQSLYDFSASLEVKRNVVDQAKVRTGLRSLVLRRDPDHWGRSMEFVINGIPIFGKGADVIPFDSFPTRVNEATYRQILQSARDANMNMVREWGGGIYEMDDFYNICDELGLIIWQDFMFGGDMYPGDAEFLDNVRLEAIDQVKRLRDHPSIVIWCGNNEVETGWIHWGDRQQFKAAVGQRTAEKIWQDYMVLFNRVLPDVIVEYGQPVPYWPSSPSANFEDEPDGQRIGDMHYWQVWHALAPIENYKQQLPRFMTEYGFQSFPEMNTIKAFSIAADWDISSPVMLSHQKNKGGNGRIYDYLLRYFGQPKDFAAFLYASQVMQAEAIKMGAEHLRRSRPRTMGSLYWQLNDCWPVASWSSIDYYGRWKALQYYARRFYSDLLVSPNEENSALQIYLVSDKQQTQAGQLRVRLLDLTGKVLEDKSADVQIKPLSAEVYLSLPVTQLLAQRRRNQVFVDAQLLVEGKPVSRNLYFFTPMKDVQLPQPDIKTTIEAAGDGYRVALQSSQLARDVYLSFADLDAKFSDNYIDLLPGETAQIEVRSKASLDQLRQAIKVTSLYDAFLPAMKEATAITAP